MFSRVKAHMFSLISAIIIKTLLTLLKPMEFSIKFNTVKSGWPIVYYIEGSQVKIFKNIDFFSEDIMSAQTL